MFSLTRIWRSRSRIYGNGNLPCSILLILVSLLEIRGLSRQVKLERSVAQAICQQSEAFAETGGFQPPLRQKPPDFADGPCGFYQYGQCDESRCHFVGFTPCGTTQSFNTQPRTYIDPGSGTNWKVEQNPVEPGQGLSLKLELQSPPKAKHGKSVGKFTPQLQGRDSEGPERPTGPGGRIVGGKPAKPHAWPSLLAVYIDGDLQCGATILSKDWVLGAAHCLVGDAYEFVAGDHIISKREGTEQTVKAIKVIKHEKYDEKPNTDMNDIALFKVSPPFKFNKNVQPVNLPKKKEKLKKGLVTVAGWGLHKSDKEGGEPQDTLQEVDLPIISHATCKKKYEKSLILETMMCTLNQNGGKDACQGDSGGPAFSMKGGKITQVGIVSWGIGCAKKNKPGVYTEVSFYLDWIKKKTGLKL